MRSNIEKVVEMQKWRSVGVPEIEGVRKSALEDLTVVVGR